MDKGKYGVWIVFILILIPVFLWFPNAEFANLPSLLRSLSQLTALVGTVLFCLNFVFAARWKFLENYFNGLNRIYIIHHLLGAMGFMLLLFHPIFIILSYLNFSFEDAINLIVPSQNNIPVQIGFVALAVMIILLIVTFYIKLEYDVWKKTHAWMGLPLFLVLFHVFFIGSTIAVSLLLKIYFIAIFIVSFFAFIYRLVFKYSRYGKYKYTVLKVNVSSDITLLTLKPVNRKMDFKPGQFVFLEIFRKGIMKESHPFSVLSSPLEENLQIAIKSLGEYTETLKLIQPDTDILMEGPYGRFGSSFMSHENQVWIGAGIGITPFVSMIRSLPENFTKNIFVYYCIRDSEESVFEKEFLNNFKNRLNIKFYNWCSMDKGRLTVNTIEQELNDLKKFEFFICGPVSLMNSLKLQLKKKGVHSKNIHTEEFSLQ